MKQLLKINGLNGKRILSPLLLLSLSSGVGCGNTAKTAITAAPGSGAGPDVSASKALPTLSEDDMKVTALNEVMRYQSASRYLVKPTDDGQTIAHLIAQ